MMGMSLKAIVLTLLALVVGATIGSLLGWWDWKTLIGWTALVD